MALLLGMGHSMNSQTRISTFIRFQCIEGSLFTLTNPKTFREKKVKLQNQYQNQILYQSLLLLPDDYNYHPSCPFHLNHLFAA